MHTDKIGKIFKILWKAKPLSILFQFVYNILLYNLDITEKILFGKNRYQCMLIATAN